jgi:hypothetical protein
MSQLDLSPLPSASPEETGRPSIHPVPGYVDDAAVLALLTGNVGSRLQPGFGALALAADEMDYAGRPSGMPDGRRG